jgi:hypothetical protein
MKTPPPPATQPKASAVTSSPPLTVNGLLQWLNQKFGWSIPLLPLGGWPSAVQALWNFVVSTALPSSEPPYPWVFTVDGNWSEILPPNSKVTLNQIKITVSQTPAPPPK